MSKLLRSLGVVVAVVLSVLTFVPSVAQAGVGNSATPTFPTLVTVGQTNVPASIMFTNTNTAPNTADANTVCNFGDAAPCPAGDPGITLIASCGQQGGFTGCQTAGFDPGVFDISSTGTGAAGTECAGISFDIDLSDAASGRVRFTPTGGANVVLSARDAECTIDFTFDVLRMPSLDALAAPGVQTLQITDNTQRSGPAGRQVTASARGTSSGTTVQRATPVIATTASADVALGAGTLTDTVIVTGRANPDPTATVSFRLFGPNDPTCTGTPVFESLDVAYPVTGGPVTSAAYTPTQTGTHRWVATYNGDTNNNTVSGTCGDVTEQTDVSKAQPAIVTTASANVTLGTGDLSDSATVTGRVNPDAGGTVDFRLYGPSDATCAGTPVFESLAVPYPIAGGAVSSGTYTPTAPGTHRWVASYSGDVNNKPATGTCGDATETTVVSLNTPVITTAASADVFVGDGNAMSDIATVTGRVNPVAGATIDFKLYGPNDVGCAGAPIFESLGVAYPVAGGSVASGLFTPTVPGTYRWVATYSGDANNSAVSGTCGDPAETTEVASTPDLDVDLPETGPRNVGMMLTIGFGSMFAGLALLASASRRRQFPLSH
ncbi:MAG: hypothetical protein HKN44_12390 [Ilumatobacter sp.]|nr:hypothetical protein [Ilumatobacter sp.]